MSLQTVRSPFVLGDYTPLSEHQEQTPDSFYDGKPVLHYHATGAKAWIPKSQRGKLPFFPADLSSAPTAPESAALSGQTEESVEQVVDLFVNSQNLSIFCPSAESGVSIPYQQISIHAIKTLRAASETYPSVYLQLELAAGGSSDDDFDTVELTLIPQPTPTAAASSADDTTTTPTKPQATLLFDAISECSNLNPDPVQDGDDDERDFDEDGAQIIFEGDREAIEGFSGVFAGAADGGLPPAMPGSGGWITAENVHEYFDEEGNWIGEGAGGEQEELGEGAGVVHGREEGEGEGGGNTMTSWNRVGLGPQHNWRRNPRRPPRLLGIRLRPRTILLLTLTTFLLLTLLLPYDNTIRLAFRWNALQLRAALFDSATPDERWVYASPPAYPVDVAEDVVVIVKTGFGTRERVPAWLDALGRGNEFRDVLVIADSEGRVDYEKGKGEEKGLKVHDAVGYSVQLHLRGWEGHPRVVKYRELTEAIYRGDEKVALELCRRFGWELDSMKFISGLEMAFQKYPHKHWYLLVDDDTFIIQPSLKPLLAHLNPNQPHYLGNAVGDFKARFAHGGSAVILSHAAMRALITNQRALASVYLDSLDETWGDRLLAKALLKLGIHLDETYSHLFNGEPPTLTKIRADRLCSPLVSFHKLPSPAAMREVGEYFRNVSKPVIWNDLWDVYGQTPPWKQSSPETMRRDWDHVGEPDESTLVISGVQSAEACEKQMKRRVKSSLAWSWDEESRECRVSHWMILGGPKNGVVSGVNVLRARRLETYCLQY
ncbi:regulator of volume decrease after cellular swelling-domain-containing protein [Chaetomium sp. MPI-SDFR-AT-0129]|nr:regulator of volume decrease after cellular swelling-domain-containing protein [Chaetomium sp. MPI-SDFR-AT-0129]